MQLLLNPPENVLLKMRMARQLGKLVDISKDKVAFDSEKSDVEKLAADEWDIRFQSRAGTQAAS